MSSHHNHYFKYFNVLPWRLGTHIWVLVNFYIFQLTNSKIKMKKKKINKNVVKVFAHQTNFMFIPCKMNFEMERISSFFFVLQEINQFMTLFPRIRYAKVNAKDNQKIKRLQTTGNFHVVCLISLHHRWLVIPIGRITSFRAYEYRKVFFSSSKKYDIYGIHTKHNSMFAFMKMSCDSVLSSNKRIFDMNKTNRLFCIRIWYEFSG